MSPNPSCSTDCYESRYGYQTSSRVKIVLVLGLTEETVKDNDIKTVCLASQQRISYAERVVLNFLDLSGYP